MTPEGPTAQLIAPKAGKLFYTINSSRAKGGERAVNMVELRKKVEEEIQKGENKTFQ